MDTRTTARRRLAPGVLVGALLLVPLAACGEDTTTGTGTTQTSVPAENTGGATGTTAPEDTAATSEPDATDATPTDSGTNADVNCAGTSCSVTLSGDGAQAEVLGTPIALGAVENGRATVRVGDQDLSCRQGETASAGPLSVECTTVSEDTVTLTATLG